MSKLLVQGVLSKKITTCKECSFLYIGKLGASCLIIDNIKKPFTVGYEELDVLFDKCPLTEYKETRDKMSERRILGVDATGKEVGNGDWLYTDYGDEDYVLDYDILTDHKFGSGKIVLGWYITGMKSGIITRVYRDTIKKMYKAND